MVIIEKITLDFLSAQKIVQNEGLDLISLILERYSTISVLLEKVISSFYILRLLNVFKLSSPMAKSISSLSQERA
jgi:hypothetical protein